MMPTAGYYIFPDFEILKPVFDVRGIETCEQMCATLFKEANVAVSTYIRRRSSDVTGFITMVMGPNI